MHLNAHIPQIINLNEIDTYYSEHCTSFSTPNILLNEHSRELILLVTRDGIFVNCALFVESIIHNTQV